MAAERFVSQADFARRRSVSRKAVTGWKQKGLLVLREDGMVDVEASEWNLDQRPANYRGGVTHRPVRAAPGNSEPAPRAKRPPPDTPAGEEPPEADAAARDMDPENLTHAEAVRRKENMLGLLRKHELEVSRREWVRVEDVAKLVEHDYATIRERLLTIPGKLAPELDSANQATIETAIRREIVEALNELHDPAGLAGRAGSGDEAAGGPGGAEAAA
ncbi:hypothetical protein [Chelatococcus reniformis]|uniref:Terminase small subunit n=1 Tax=Chelatococcus reniformis TaxID=1494448 RepID=A0A916XHG2_9HYPH|nr:hypothetical protein [Chelatococcus reniformis]GGC70713.1 hypothetical protein GCM10010994_31580 [Chelatococcus reniformis]